ncbi:MAG: GDP-mannose 4,6-dehydratase [Solirubrobacterales bacterium]|nr:GDP-mannose 4,6-dehydratase [Solirubrobacterales bacterium]
MRALITGASGFAGTWLCRECLTAGDEVIALSRSGVAPGGGRALAVDLEDEGAVTHAVREAAPEVVYHLAALSSVGRSWEAPARTLRENVGAAANLLEALRLHAPGARIVWVSTCEVYGDPTRLPVAEDAPVAPANPYAVSKLCGEQLCEVYRAAYGLEIVRARPFSHSGPGQRPIFLLSSLTRQAAEGRRAGVRELRIVTGNPDTRRDFTDVRDIVRAYRLLATGRRRGIYNVSTGESISAGDQVRLLAELLAPIAVEHVVDPNRVRAHEVMDLRGDRSRLTADTGWEPTIPFRQTMAETIDWWERELDAETQPARGR